jgi:hypothetical protein
LNAVLINEVATGSIAIGPVTPKDAIRPSSNQFDWRIKPPPLVLAKEVPELPPNTLGLPIPAGVSDFILIESTAVLVEMNFDVPEPQALNSIPAKKLEELGAATATFMSIFPAPELTSVPLTTGNPTAQTERADDVETVWL